MKNYLKVALVGWVALSMTSAALAQESASPKAPPEQREQMMSSGDMAGHGDMPMNDPDMRRRMAQMMDRCEKMMEQKAVKAAASAAPGDGARHATAGRYEWRTSPSYGPRAPLRAPQRVWVPAMPPADIR